MLRRRLRGIAARPSVLASGHARQPRAVRSRPGDGPRVGPARSSREADIEAFEAFRINVPIGLPAVARATSHRTMRLLRG